MSSILDLVNQQLQGPQLAQLSNQLGVDERTTRQAVPAAVAALTGALARNASQPQGAFQLDNALSRDHDGSILDNLGGFLGGGNTSPGFSILRHVLGARQPVAEQNVGRVAGIDPATAARLLALLAPIVMAALARRKQQQGVDAQGLPGLLGNERRHIEQTLPQQLPQARAGGLGGLLDLDGDGQVMDDLANLAGGLLGNRR